jgi:hypothetical protein
MLDGGGGGGGGEAAGLFPYAEDDNLSASPATISGLADGIEGVAGNLEVLNPNIDSAHRPALTGTAGVLHSVAATAPQPTKNNINQVLLATLCAAGATRVFGTDGVEAYNGHVDDIRSEYYRRKAEIMASDCGVPAASYPEGATQEQRSSIDNDRASDVSSARTSAVAALVRELQGRQDTFKDDPLDAQATTAANRLEQGPTDQVIQDIYSAGGLPLATVAAFPGLNLKLEGGNLPSDLAAMTPEELATYLIDHPEITDPNILLNLDDEVEAEIGRQLAEYTRTHLLPFPIGDEDVNKLNSALDRFGLGVDAQFINALGGADTLALVAGLARQAHDPNGNRMTLLNNVRDAVGTATSGPFLEEYEQRELANEFVNALEDYSRKSAEDPEAIRGVEPPSLALSWLLDDQYHGTPFLDTLGDRLDTFERTYPYFHSWESIAHDHMYDGTWENLMGRDEGAFDPMASYMSALGRNGEASLQFFTEGDSRQEYWIQERKWGHDDFEGLLSALDSATTDEDNLGNPDAARLVSAAVDYLTNRDNNDRVEFGGDDEEFQPGDINGAAAESLAHMMGTYMAAVDYTNTEGGTNEVGVHGLDARDDLALLDLGMMPNFEQSELRDLFQVGVSNEEGFTAFREATSNYQNYHMSVMMEHRDDPGFYDNPDTEQPNDGFWQQATSADARLEGLMLDSIGEVEIAEGLDKDKQIKAWIAMGQRLAGTIPVASGLAPFTQTAIGLGGFGLEDALAKYEEQAISDSNEAATAALMGRTGGIVESLHDGGRISDADLQAAATAAGVTEDEYNQYFAGGNFPDADEISSNQRLYDMMIDLANDHVDMNNYRINYENAFHRYFE